jgi:GcrA cell cycle regulator
MQASHCRADRFARPAWTPARVRNLKRLWSQGASATRIARELGAGVSRNAVLGKIRRLGLIAVRSHPRRSRRSSRMGNRTPPSHAVPDHLRASERADREWPFFPAWIVDTQSYADNPGIDADIPPAQRRSFLDLNSHTCRWPVGDPGGCDFFFCGAPPVVGKPYCAAHCARAYVRSAPGSADVASALGLAGKMPAVAGAAAKSCRGGGG